MRLIAGLLVIIGLFVFFASNWLLGGIMVIMGLLMVIAMSAASPKEEPERSAIQAGVSKKCPYCAEIIKREAIVCRFCGRDLPTLKSIASALYDSASSTGSDLSEQEVQEYAAAFDSIGWKEPLGPNTLRALTMLDDPFDPSKEPPICVAYADAQGPHISSIRIGNEKLKSSHAALIATHKRLLLVDPNKPIAHDIRYESIARVQPISQTTSPSEAVYTLNTTDGTPVEIAATTPGSTSEDVRLILAALFRRISPISTT